LERIAAALESVIPLGLAPAQRRPSGAALVPGLNSQDRAILGELKADIAQVKVEVAEIKQLLTAERGEVVKETYTVEEVAKKAGYKPFTIRQACNKGRIEGAYKGRDHAWRIPRNSLLDILTNGLAPE
jgi:hypothetical protein